MDFPTDLKGPRRLGLRILLGNGALCVQVCVYYVLYTGVYTGITVFTHTVVRVYTLEGTKVHV